MHVNIKTNGTLSFIYSDQLQPLLELGTPTVRRASHVEPTADGRWTADLSPVNGPTFGPFTVRAIALGVELDWLRANGF